MLFGYLTLATALILSLSAAVYSILGLTAIFAAAFWPIVVLGGSLEIGKIVTVLWLHKYWKQAEIQYKLYLSSAVVVLMILTSMGVFGFLSKAHLDQAIPSGDVQAQVQIFDDKIRTQKDNIDAARKALSQMDAAVDQTMSRSSSEQGADKAANLRRSQGRERTALQNDISKAQKEITGLQEQRAPIASQARKVDAEVGPIKYIAALIYGDNPDTNVLEKAVRWVIILIVIVFDPLALTLLLAATKAFEWEHNIDLFNIKKKKEEKEGPFDDWTEEDFDALNKSLKDAEDEAPEPIVEEVESAEQKKLRWAGFSFPMTSVFNKKEELVKEPVEQLVIDDEVHEEDPLKEAKRAWKLDHPTDTLKKYERLHNAGHLKTLPWEAPEYNLGLEADNAPNGPTGEVKGFGTVFPKEAVKGDMYLRVDQIPSQLYKFNGRNWIEVDKNLTDQHAYDEAYIDHLISKIESGEYDPELLSDAERDSIEKRLG
jgi:hypothetical protein